MINIKFKLKTEQREIIRKTFDSFRNYEKAKEGYLEYLNIFFGSNITLSDNEYDIFYKGKLLQLKFNPEIIKDTISFNSIDSASEIIELSIEEILNQINNSKKFK